MSAEGPGLIARNSTTVNAAYNRLSISYSRQPLADFTVEQIALGFINAVKRLALGDAKAILIQYSNAGQEYPDDMLRISMDSAGYRAHAQKTSASVMYALKTLPIILMHDGYLAGVNFYERYGAMPLYNGMFDKMGDPHDLQLPSKSTTNSSMRGNGQKRSSDPEQSDGNSTVLSITSPNNNAYEIKISLRGREIGKTTMFSVILEFLFVLGLEDAGAVLTSPAIANWNMPAWIFAKDNQESTIPFQVFQLLGILEAIARYCVLQNSYRELVFDLYADNDQHIARGCVTRPDRASMWCNELEENGQQGSSNKSTALSSV